MNAKVSANARTKASKVLTVAAVAAAMIVGASSVYAEPHGGVVATWQLAARMSAPRILAAAAAVSLADSITRHVLPLGAGRGSLRLWP